MRVAVIGAGYVGLVSAACFADKGHHVTLVDTDRDRVRQINAGHSPFYEADLEEILQRTQPERLRATADLAAAVREAELTLLAVGTPFVGGRSDLSQIEGAAREIGLALKGSSGYHLVVVKSTVPPGTTDGLVASRIAAESGRRLGEGFGVAMNPEFLREGVAVADFLYPDRIVMGAADDRGWELQDMLYTDFPCPDRVRTSNATAEMIKYTSNALLASLISFSNEIGNLCGELEGVDVVDVLEAVHLDKRLSPILADGERVAPGILSYLMAGCGFGGSCLPKDTRSLVAFGRQRGLSMDLLSATVKVNDEQTLRLVEILERHFESLEGQEVTLLGLAFKPGTSDIRQAPALAVASDLLDRGARLRVYDPVAQHQAALALGTSRVHYAEDLEDAIDGAAAVVLVTSWPEFADLPARIAELAEPPLVVDGRRMFEKQDLPRYDAIGLGPGTQSSIEAERPLAGSAIKGDSST